MHSQKSEWLKNLKEGSHIHLMGICGTAMASLAGLLKQKGYYITGSDKDVYPPMSLQLQKLNIPISETLDKLKSLPDLVVVGNVMTRKHKEVEFLLKSDIPYTSLPEVIGESVIADQKSIVICGTHGKTTCTALLSWVLTSCGKKPGFLIGGIPQNFGFSFRLSTFESREGIFVIEGDEYDSAFFDKVPKFIHYKPEFVILTSIEMDHIDIYPNFAAVKVAFRKLIQMIPQDGLLVVNGQDKVISEMLKESSCRNIKSYALYPKKSYIPPDYWAENIQKDQMDVVSSDRAKDMTLQLSLFGDHNRANALAVYALISEMNMGFSNKSICKGFKSFLGIKRRQEIIGRQGGITVIDDFAHHPTAVRETIKSVQGHFENSRVISIFEPRSATSRRAIFQQEYIDAFLHAQFVILSDVYKKDLLSEGERLDVEKLVRDIQNKKRANNLEGQVFLSKSLESIVDLVKQNAQKGDVVLIMSNGAFGGLHSKILNALEYFI